MIYFFQSSHLYYAVKVRQSLIKQDIYKLTWLFDDAVFLQKIKVEGTFIGPRKEMITPWSTNAVEITQNMGIHEIERIEQFTLTEKKHPDYDPMLQALYDGLHQDIFTIEKEAEKIRYIQNIESYNQSKGLALSHSEVLYLKNVSIKIGRKLTDSEVYGFAQLNSEHCRHKIFNGTFIIDGKEMPESLFSWIKKTSKTHPNFIVSSYKDNVAFIEGPEVELFHPENPAKSSYFVTKNVDSVLSLKAETHNFPTTVEPFNGAATGSGGEIRDRMAGGKGSFPIAGTAVYMTSYPRTEKGRNWEKDWDTRQWLYQSPDEILIKASNGASDFGNKFGQPLICGSLLTFEQKTDKKMYAYDKVVMLAGGVGYAKKSDALKEEPQKNDAVVVLGGDNYRIGMGGGAVSSVNTGQLDQSIELNAVQRSNPEMQKRVYNVIRAFAEEADNDIISIHDHGAGGHLNSLSELIENSGGVIHIDKLPVGDPTLSAREIIGNESQERMGLIIHKKDFQKLKEVSERERAPIYLVGKATQDNRIVFQTDKEEINPIDLELQDFFGNTPKTYLKDNKISLSLPDLDFDNNPALFKTYLSDVLQLEGVACKDWLTNKVDRSVTGKIALQQCCGEIQLPLNNLGVTTLDYLGKKGIAVSMGHAPASGLIDAKTGSVLSVCKALTNIIWVPLTHGLKGISLSANWMWPANNEGENARLYEAVEGISNFAMELGVNIPTGKDSLSMTQKYENQTVYSPGTVIVTAVAEVSDVKKAVTPDLKNVDNSWLYYIPFAQEDFALGGSSFAQSINQVGNKTPEALAADKIQHIFSFIQNMIRQDKILAGHDVAAGGLITSLLEMCFPTENMAWEMSWNEGSHNIYEVLFSEQPGIIIQCEKSEYLENEWEQNHISFYRLAEVKQAKACKIHFHSEEIDLDIAKMRQLWFKTSYLLDKKQSAGQLAERRYKNYSKQILNYIFPKDFKGNLQAMNLSFERKQKSGIQAAIIREKGVNGDREMAYSLYLAGFDVKDVHMTDLMSGKENLEDINMIVFVGGFSNSDVLGSAKGWAGVFLYNEKAKTTLENFYKRKDTLSLGVCNGCQLMMELNLLNIPEAHQVKMKHNNSHKFESAFINVNIPKNNSVMLENLSGTRLGIWVAHGEGKFSCQGKEKDYHIAMKYSYDEYPGNPNGSDFDIAALCSADGRHLVMMPHLERSVFSWQWAYYPQSRQDEVSPWIQAFVNAKKWIENKK